MIGTNDVEQLRAFVLQIIAERTMPREWSFPDDNWLMPYYRIVEMNTEIEAHLNAVHEQIELLKRRITMLEKGIGL